jgi:hypothetical protein
MEQEDDRHLEFNAVLPDDLQVLAVEIEFERPRSRFDEDSRHDSASHLTEWEFVSAIEICLEEIGSASVFRPSRASVFSKLPRIRLRFDVIAPKGVLEQWLPMEKGLPNLSRLPFLRTARIIGFKIFNNLAHLNDYSDTGEARIDDRFKGTYLENFASAGDWAFAPGDFHRWVRAAQATDRDFERLLTLSHACGQDAAVMGTALERHREIGWIEPQPFLVPGLIPQGAVTLLLGNKKVGKSAIAMELAVAVARREAEWLGFPLNKEKMRGFTVYLSGEDSEETAMERVSLMSDGENPMMLEIIPADGSEIDTLLDRLKKQKIDLLIVDPARKYYKGDEDSSDATSEFFTKLEKFAREKQCAVLVLHHLKRNANPRTLADVARQYRGSSVFLDRPRVTLAILRQSDETHVGIPAPDGVPLHNFRQSTMFSGIRRLRREEKSFRHAPIDGQAVPKEIAAGVVDRVLKAVSRLLREGQRITRTGRAAVFERKAPEVVGLSRVTVRDAVERLLATGQLCCDTHGALVLPDAAA